MGSFLDISIARVARALVVVCVAGALLCGCHGGVSGNSGAVGSETGAGIAGADTGIAVANGGTKVNAEGYDGGDVAKRAMSVALQNAQTAFTLINWGVDHASLCSPSSCDKERDGSACDLLTALKSNPAQHAQARAFLMSPGMTKALLEQAASVSLEIGEAVTVDGVAVSAKTEPKSGGPVIVARVDALAMSTIQRIMILTHELGHKIALAGGQHVTDNESIQAFSTGRLFLDTVGACVGAYFQAHRPSPGTYDELFGTGGVHVTSVSQSLSQAVMSHQPIGYWRLDETSGTVAADSSGLGHAGSYHGGVKLGEPGAFGPESGFGATFDGISGYVKIPTTSMPRPTEISVEMWCLAPPAGTDPQGSCSVGDRSQFGTKWRGFALFLRAANNAFHFHMANSAGSPTAWNVGEAISGSDWYHVVGVHGAQGHDIYVNGVLSAAQTGGETNWSGRDLMLGKLDGPAELRAGRMDDVAIYPRVLDAAEIKRHYGLRSGPISSPARGVSVSVDGDGRIVSLVWANDAHGDLVAVQRFRSNGAPDPTFGTSGTVVTPLRPTPMGVDKGIPPDPAIAIQDDGKILVLASQPHADTWLGFAILRLNTDGTPDRTFGVQGLLMGHIDAHDHVAAIAVAPGGKIVIGGYAIKAGQTKRRASLARLNADGSFDTSFNGTGKRLIDFSPSLHDGLSALLVQGDGTVFATGYAGIGTTGPLAVVKVKPDGSLDTGFGGTGFITQTLGPGWNNGTALLRQPIDGKIVVAGQTSFLAAEGPAWLLRYNPDGTPDRRFNRSGALSYAVTDTTVPHALALQEDGKILMGGTAHATPRKHFIARFLPDGSLDTSFDETGAVVETMGHVGSAVSGLAAGQDGKILVTGSYEEQGGRVSGFLMRLWQ